MSHQLGLSIGTTNLVAARVGEPPMVRRAVLRLYRDRAPQIGLAADALDDGVPARRPLVQGGVDRGDVAGVGHHQELLVLTLRTGVGPVMPKGERAPLPAAAAFFWPCW